MLEEIKKLGPIISVTAVASLAIFNIGYFWNIGLHFLGLVDLSNLVYSFALSIALIFIIIHMAGLILPRVFTAKGAITVMTISSVIMIVAIFVTSAD